MSTPQWITVPCPTCWHDVETINGRWLKEQRELAQMTQREFGVLVHRSCPYISDIERNRRQCPERILVAYQRLLAARR